MKNIAFRSIAETRLLSFGLSKKYSNNQNNFLDLSKKISNNAYKIHHPIQRHQNFSLVSVSRPSISAMSPLHIPVIADRGIRSHFELSTSEKTQIEEAISQKKYDPNGSESYVSEIRQAIYPALPKKILSTLSQFRAPDSGEPFAIFDNLPVDANITGSPRKNETGKQFKNGTITENALVALASVIGEPYSIKHEGQELVNNLVPSKAASGQYTGLGYDVELDFHSENAMQARQPQGDTAPTELLLYGVRDEPNETGPKTKVADCREALKLLSPDDVRLLREPIFFLKAPYRWRGTPDAEAKSPTMIRSPIVSGPEHAPRVTVAFYPDMMDGLSPAAVNAINTFHKALKEVAVGIRIRPGRLVVINNRFSVHSRDKFDATFDPNGFAYRWIQRLFTRPDLWNFREFGRFRDRVFVPPLPDDAQLNKPRMLAS